ncbi:MAG: sugar phosphate isomerase/epimerase family protein [Cetobacterium sp.]
MIGVRGHDLGVFTIDSIDELIKKIKFYKYTHIQLVLWKSFSDIDENLNNLTNEKIDIIFSKFKVNNISISVLGAYYNMISPNLNERINGFNRFEKMLKLANKLGGSFVATETGSFNKDMSFNEENHSLEAFNTVVSSTKNLIKIAEKNNSYVGIEGVYTLSIWNIDTLKKLYSECKSKHLKFIFDPVNLISENNYLDQDNLIINFFENFGNSIEIVHFKDFIIKNNKVTRVPPGKGLLNYPLLIKLMKELNLKGVIEEIDESEMPESIFFLNTLI